MGTPYAVVFRLGNDADWRLANLRMHQSPNDAANAAADWVRAQLLSLGYDRTTAREHVHAMRVAVREHPDQPVAVTLPGRHEPLLHVMTVTVDLPAARRDYASAN